MGSSRYDWRNDIALPVAFAMLRACWLCPWLELVRRWLPPARLGVIPSLPLLMVIFLTAMATAHYALTSKSLLRARVLAAGTGLPAVLLVLWWQFYHAQYALWDVRWIGALASELTHWGEIFPGLAAVLISAAYLWLRGLLDGRRRLNSDDAWGAFMAAFLGMVLSLGAAILDGRGVPAGTEGYVLLLFAAGMASLAISGLQMAHWPQPGSDAAGPSSVRYWLFTVSLVIGGLLVLGVGLSIVISPATVARVLSWGSILLRILGQVVYYIAVILGYPLFLILQPLLNWMQTSPRPDQPSRQVEMPVFQKELEEWAHNAPTRQAVNEALRWAGLAVVVLIIGLAFVLAIRRLWPKSDEDLDETRETIFSSQLLRDQLSALWRSWQERRRRDPPIDPFLSLSDELPTRRLIRAIYQALLSRASQSGRARSPEQTPAEYERTMASTLPGAQAPLRTITHSYLLARYAPDAPTSEQAAEAQLAWNQLGELLPEEAGDL